MAITQTNLCERVVNQRIMSLSPGELELVKELCAAGVLVDDIIHLIWLSRALRLKRTLEKKLGRPLTDEELLKIADLLAAGKSFEEIFDLLDGPKRDPAP
ncbi:hypothetical protein [Xanthomonas translucens]|uniref:hypothetical protein n=1 Tax=Xanthomonas campestris pv. translucens TaxID=343 RepID=UPI0012D9A2A4|nr:hypothetical protein [Xanthomonas translucens]